MAEWLERAGLSVEKAVDLKPESDRQLTVTIWLARDRRAAAPKTNDNAGDVERTRYAQAGRN